MFGGPGTPVHPLCPSSMCKFPGPPGGPLSELTIGSFFFYKILFIPTSAEEPGHAGSTRSQEHPSSARWVYSPLPFMA